MSKPSTSSSSSSTTVVEYDARPEDITQLRNRAANATPGCCTCAYRKSGRFGSFNKIHQLRADGVTPNGQNDSSWKGEVIVESDGTSGTVTVYHGIKALNKTSDTGSYPDTVPMNNEDLAARIAKIPPAIERAWNARPYRLKITDAQCGERLFVVTFIVQIVTSGEHFTIDFVNVPGMGTANDVRGILSGRSYILPPDRGKFNLGDPRTASDNNASQDCLEPHEYGHMIGLKDEYLDVPHDRGGVKYEFPDGTRETVAVNGELMGNMEIKTARPPRYCVTIAYAAIAVLESHGCAVTDCEIL
ncbi:hypothetical protein [Polyangium aurulentum]|uniref:hypothetical protein n=1 Tax=Polyangium aurulentum TaxID=2567896 RepID=UPI0010AE2104|nr:hypothetical protein [Polyangium aurulentum]UQA63189.1 hypothetical protein E8A73_023080 [Polyangium aurulentum]